MNVGDKVKMSLSHRRRMCGLYREAATFYSKAVYVGSLKFVGLVGEVIQIGKMQYTKMGWYQVRWSDGSVRNYSGSELMVAV